MRNHHYGPSITIQLSGVSPCPQFLWCRWGLTLKVSILGPWENRLWLKCLWALTSKPCWQSCTMAKIAVRTRFGSSHAISNARWLELQCTQLIGHDAWRCLSRGTIGYWDYIRGKAAIMHPIFRSWKLSCYLILIANPLHCSDVFPDWLSLSHIFNLDDVLSLPKFFVSHPCQNVKKFNRIHWIIELSAQWLGLHPGPLLADTRFSMKHTSNQQP